MSYTPVEQLVPPLMENPLPAVKTLWSYRILIFLAFQEDSVPLFFEMF
jgi:hypothetical protein